MGFKLHPKRPIVRRLELLCLAILTGVFVNFSFMAIGSHWSPSSALDRSPITVASNELGQGAISSVERSKNALDTLKKLLDSVRSANSEPWIWTPSAQYPSVPYQPTLLSAHEIPQTLRNISIVPLGVNDEVDRVCQRLIRANESGGHIWCQLFRQCYSDTLARTSTLLSDDTTYIITGDIDLMWLRDSSAQVHHYLPLWKDSSIQRIIEGLIRRQTRFIFANPYGSAFRLTLRPNPPSDDSLEAIHVQKGRNVHVAMHNYELDSLCYHLRLSYSWWKQSHRSQAFDQQWLVGVSMIIQVMIIEQHHSQISPYRYTELDHNHRGPPVAYTGMTWSAYRPSDDRTTHGYLIPSNMMACVVLKQLIEMVQTIHSEQSQLLTQMYQLRADILAGIHTYGVVNDQNGEQIYAFETDGFSQHLLLDDANVPSLLSAAYLGFKTPYDPQDRLLQATRRFVLSSRNPLFFKGTNGSGVGSDHTEKGHVWPMSIVMEGFTAHMENTTNENLDSVWKRVEASHAGTFSMHESFDVNDPTVFTRKWFAWADSLLAELILSRLDRLEDWLQHRRFN